MIQEGKVEAGRAGRSDGRSRKLKNKRRLPEDEAEAQTEGAEQEDAPRNLGPRKGQRQWRVVDLVTSRVQVPRQTTWRSAKDSFGDCCRDLSLLCFVIVLASMQCNVMA